MCIFGNNHTTCFTSERRDNVLPLVCKNDYKFKDREVIHEYLVQSDFMDNYFIWSKHGETQPIIVDERIEENIDSPDHMYSHHDDGCENDIGQNDAGRGDEGFDVDELMHKFVPDVLLQRRNKGFENFMSLDNTSRDLLSRIRI
jgi:hypothetical protein